MSHTIKVPINIFNRHVTKGFILVRSIKSIPVAGLMFAASWSASADEFKVFGITLDSMSQSYLESLIPSDPNKSGKYKGFRVQTDFHGYPDNETDTELLDTMSFYGTKYDASGSARDPFSRELYGKHFNIPEYVYHWDYTEAQKEGYHRALEASRWELGTDLISEQRMWEIDDPRIDPLKRKYWGLKNVSFGNWYYCDKESRYSAQCPDGLAKEGVARIWIFHPDGPIAGAPTMRVGVQLEDSASLTPEEARAVVTKQYPSAEVTEFMTDAGKYTVLSGTRENLLTNGQFFIIQIKSKQFKSIMIEPTVKRDEELVSTFLELQTIGREAIASKKKSNADAVFGDN